MKTNSLKGLLINLLLVSSLFLLLSFTFFYKILPSLTNKNKIVTVPDVRGMAFADVSRLLTSRDLNYEVGDSSFNSDVAPLTVLAQFPQALSKVKANRKIILKLNAKVAPLVTIPDLTGATSHFAQNQLKALDLKIGSVTYRPDIAVNAILEISHNGKILLAGQKVKKGSTISLVIGSSAGEELPAP